MLQSCFQAPKAEIVAVIQTLLRNKRLKNQRAKIIWQTLRRFAQPNAGFADYLSAEQQAALSPSHFDTYHAPVVPVSRPAVTPLGIPSN